MRVTIGTTVYRVWWKHNRLMRETECFIQAERTLLACAFQKGAVWTGTARCSASDRFDKEIGRKVSLKRALMDRVLHGLTPSALGTYGDHFRQDRGMRRLFWQAYFERE